MVGGGTLVARRGRLEGNRLPWLRKTKEESEAAAKLPVPPLLQPPPMP